MKGARLVESPERRAADGMAAAGATRVAGVIQARVGSSRLPGKILAPICGAPLLSHVVARARRARFVHEWIVATSDAAADDPVVGVAESAGCRVFRGSEDDVLDRFVGAARWAGADVIVRVTGDSPLVESGVIDMAVDAHLGGRVDYTGAKNVAEFPLGTGCEVVARAALERAWIDGRAAEDREHVTYYILQHPEDFKLQFIPNTEPWRGLPVRLVVDELPDLMLVRELFSRIGPANPGFGMKEIWEVYRREPAIFTLNAAVEERPTSFLSMRHGDVPGGV